MELKKGIFLFLLSFVYILQLSAQDAYWGIKAGMNFNKVGGIEFDNAMYTGYQGGLFGTFIVNDRFSFQHELMYSSRGLNGTLTNGDPYKIKLNYIDIPWLLNYHVNQAIFVQAGVQASIYTYFKPARYDSIPYNRYNASVFDFSAIIGAGVILNNNCIFGIRLNQSFSPTFNIRQEGGKVLNLQAYIGYAFNRDVKRGRSRSFSGGGGGYR